MIRSTKFVCSMHPPSRKKNTHPRIVEVSGASWVKLAGYERFITMSCARAKRISNSTFRVSKPISPQLGSDHCISMHQFGKLLLATKAAHFFPTISK